MRYLFVLIAILHVTSACRLRQLDPRAELHADTAEVAALAQRAGEILTARCGDCHANGADEGGFDFVDQVDVLAARGLVVPGNVAQSKLAARINSNEMPPASAADPLSAAEKQAINDWIVALGRKEVNASVPQVALLSFEDQYQLMLADLTLVHGRDRAFTRYVSNAHIANARFADGKPVYDAAEVQVHRDALVKFLNSISRQPLASIAPVAGSNLTLFRTDLRDFGLTAAHWSSLKQRDDYEIYLPSEAAERLRKELGDQGPVMRGDWLIVVASVPPLYDQLLGIPATVDALVQQLFGPGYSIAQALQRGDVVRAGFNGSGVSSNNRMIDRHPYPLGNGAFWISYDFGSNIDRQNLFQFPLGPREAFSNSFEHDGGEIIFTLPNGLHGYMLTDGRSRNIPRVDATDIVKDPAQRDGKVINGRSCMRCHSQGIIFQEDQVLSKFRAGGVAPNIDLAALARLYKPDEVTRLQKLDRDNFMATLQKLGINPNAPDPVHNVVRHFEANLFLEKAAGEVGINPDELRRIIRNDATLFAAMGNILTTGGIVQRDVFRQHFKRIGTVAYAENSGGNSAPPSIGLPGTQKPGTPANAGGKQVILCSAQIFDRNSNAVLADTIDVREDVAASLSAPELEQNKLRVATKALAKCEQSIRGLSRYRCQQTVSCSIAR